MKNLLLYAATAAMLGGCGQPEPAERKPIGYDMPESCHMKHGPEYGEHRGVDLVVPAVYTEQIANSIDYMENMSRNHPRVGMLEEVVFYNPNQPECYEFYGIEVCANSRAKSDAQTFIWVNEQWFYFSFWDQFEEYVDWKSHLVTGPEYVFYHEHGHILLQEKLDSMEQAELDPLAPREMEDEDGNMFSVDQRHYVVDEYGHLVKMAWALEHQAETENNPVFDNNILPAVESDNMLMENAHNQIDSWSLETVYRNETWHNNVVEFMVNEGAILPDFAEPLKYENITPYLEQQLALQKQNARDKLDNL